MPGEGDPALVTGPELKDYALLQSRIREIVAAFIFVSTPVGFLVFHDTKLTGCIARVLDQNEGIVRPVIQLLSDSDENELEDKAVINLMDNKEFYVIDCMETPPVR